MRHAGVDATTVKYFRIELDFDDGVKKYEIEFAAGGFEYEYDINAVTGTVLKNERERDWNVNVNENVNPNENATGKTEPADTGKTEDKTQTVTENITREKALSIAYDHAGVLSTSAYDVEAELDREKGREIYEIEFSANGYDYEYDVDALTGEVLKSERERDD